MSETQKIVFKNMTVDCQERMALLFASGMVVDQSFSRLLDNMERVE
ncbi:MAG: hypothetical protein P8Y42_16265 [Exilibacterium sp.]